MWLCRSSQTAVFWLYTFWRSHYKGSGVGYRVSAVRAPSMSCLFIRGTEWADNLKIAHFTPLCGACCLSEIAKHGQSRVWWHLVFPTIDWHQQQVPWVPSQGSRWGHVTFPSQQAESHFFKFKQHCAFICYVLPYSHFYWKGGEL